MKAKMKRKLAWILAAVMMLPNLPYNGSLTVYASNTDGSPKIEQQILNEDEPGGGSADDEQKPDDGSTDEEQKPGGGSGGDEQKPGGSTDDQQKPGDSADDGQKPDGGSGGDEQKPGGSTDDVQKPDDSTGGEQKPGDGNGDEDNLPGGGLNPGDNEPSDDDETTEECEHSKVRYESCEDGTHEVVCEACDTVVRTEDCTYEETVSDNSTDTVRTCSYCGYVLEEEEELETSLNTFSVTPRDSQHKRIAYFSFDNETDGFKGAGAKAEKNGNPSLAYGGCCGKALELSGSQYLNVTKEDGTSLLTGLEGITVSFFSKSQDENRDGAGWAFYAAPDDTPPVYNNTENYLGILDHKNEVRAEKFIGNRNQPTTTKASVNNLANEWRHVIVTYDSQGTRVYIDGALKETGTNEAESNIANMLGNSSIIQIGKGQRPDRRVFDLRLCYGRGRSGGALPRVRGR